MATRWCGNCKITVSWDDRTSLYKGTVTCPGVRYPFKDLGPPPAQMARIAVDSVEAYDLAAGAIMGFCTYDNDDAMAHAEMDEDGSYYVIRRTKGGRIAAKVE